MIWRQLRLRPGRSFLTVSAVAVGVAALVSVSIATATTRGHYQRLQEAISGKAALEVAGPSGSRFEQSVLSRIQDIPGVKVAVPQLRQVTRIVAGYKRSAMALAVGIDPKREQAFIDAHVAEGRMCNDPGEVLLDHDLARSLRVRLGDRVRLATKDMLYAKTVVGLVERETASGMLQGFRIYLPLGELQRLFNAHDQIDLIHLVLKDRAQFEQIREAIATRLPPDLMVRGTTAAGPSGKEVFESLEQGLNACTVLLVASGILLSLNTFLINLGERRRQFAILRAIGATNDQVTSLMVREALLVGAVGTVFGIVLGVLGGQVLMSSFRDLLQLSSATVEVPALAIVLGALFGPGIALLAVSYPAHQARRISPMEAMRGATPTAPKGYQGLLLALGLSNLAASAALMVISSVYLPPGWLLIGASTWVLGACLLLLAVIQEPILAAAARVFGLVRAVESQLACRQVLRHPGRTMLTTGVLFIVMSTIVGVSNAVFTMVGNVQDWYDRAVPADFIMGTMMPRLDDPALPGIPLALKDEIARIPGVRKIEPISVARCKVGQQDAILVLRDFGQYTVPPLDLKQGAPLEVQRGLATGGVLVNAWLAQELKIRVGDTITIQTESGALSTQVAGVVVEFGLSRGIVTIDRSLAGSLAPPDIADTLLIVVDRSQADPVETTLRKICEENGLVLQTQGSARRLLNVYLTSVIGGLWLLLFMGFVTATFGVLNTMAINLLEQTRELGVLRAIGMDRSQVKRMFVIEGLLLGSVGLLPGVLVGLALASVVNLSFTAILGYALPFRSHLHLVLAMLGLGFALVAGAALILGRRAAHLDIRTAIHYE